MNTLQVARQKDSLYGWAQKLLIFLANLVTWPDPTRPVKLYKFCNPTQPATRVQLLQFLFGLAGFSLALQHESGLG